MFVLSSTIRRARIMTKVMSGVVWCGLVWEGGVRDITRNVFLWWERKDGLLIFLFPRVCDVFIQRMILCRTESPLVLSPLCLHL